MATFKYEDVDYEFADPDSWTTLECIKLEAHTGKKPREIIQEFLQWDAIGVHSFAWVSLRRAGVDVAWDELQLPLAATLMSLRGEPVTEPPDPSTASTAKPKAARRTRSAPARSPKK